MISQQTQNQPPVLSPTWRPLRLATLVRLRWLAVVGQLASVLFVAYGLGFPLPMELCLALVGLSVVVNLSLMGWLGTGHRLTNRFAGLQLAYDCLQLGALLALTGGLTNPFSLLLLAPVSVSGSTLTQKATLWLSILVMLIVSSLAIFYLPLPWYPEAPLVLPTVYVTSTWAALLLGVAFIASYTNRVAYEARQLTDALTATEMALSSQQHLSALDGLAAAAAHELGTPLSTIALAAKEMRADLSNGTVAEDVDLIIEQSARCRAILGKLRNLGADDGDPFAQLPLNELVAELTVPISALGKSFVIATGEHSGPEPIVRRNVGLLYGLGNLLENAAQFARAGVNITISWQADAFTITITDDGEGFAPDLISRLGEPYLTTRAMDESDDPAAPGGLGLGIFIAKTLLERTGAKLRFLNTDHDGHARVIVHWPHGVIEPS